MLKSQRLLIRVLFVLALLVGLAVPAAEPVLGASITVTTFNDELNSNGNCSLREAIVAANTDRRVDRCPAGGGTDTIYLKAGTYNLSIAGMNEDAARTGDLDLTKGVKINGAGRTATFINANGLDRIFEVLPGVTADIRNLVVQNGSIGQAAFYNGGGIRNQGTLTLYKVRFNANRTGHQNNDEAGGGLYSTGTVTVTSSVFDDNGSEMFGAGAAVSGKATFVETRFDANHGLRGGGLYIFGAGTVVTVDDSKFVGNRCEVGQGSSIYIDQGTKLTVTRGTFDGDHSCDGPVIVSHGDTLVRYSNFVNNRTAFVIHAGGFNSPFRLFFSTLTNNNFGLAVGSGSTLVDRSSFVNSTGYALRVNGGTLRVTNSTVSGTMKGSTGAQCALCQEAGRLEVVNVTEAATDPAMVSLRTNADFEPGSTFVHNSILSTCRQDIPGITSGGYNIVVNGDGCNWPTATGDQVGTGAAPVNPMLTHLVVNPSQTPIYALMPGSPAIDTADPAMCFRSDQHLTPRPQGPRCDIGAFEYVPDGATSAAPAPEYLSEEPAP